MLICLLALTASCASGVMTPKKPVEFDLSVCDEKAMDLPAKHPTGREWRETDTITVKQLRVIQAADADCGNAALDYGDANRDIAAYNYTAAKHNSPDGFVDSVIFGAKAGGIGGALGFIIGMLAK